MPAKPHNPNLNVWTPETARLAAAKSVKTRQERAEMARQLAAFNASQPQLLTDNLTLAYSETLVMLRNTKSPQARFQLAKAVEALKRAMESQGRRGITVVNPPTATSSKPALPPPRPVMPAGHRAAESPEPPAIGQVDQAPAHESNEVEQPKEESAGDRGHPATW